MASDSLSRYRILRELPPGSAGRTFLARDPKTDCEVRVKTLELLLRPRKGERLEESEPFRRLQQELRAASGLSHPGIVALLDAGWDGETPFLVTEHLESAVPLDRFRERSRLLPPTTVATLVAAAAEALDHAHRASVVHGDIRPANLLRVSESAIKVADFGLGRAQALARDGTQKMHGYLAPEQVRGESLDGRSDLFSLTVVLFELLTGQHPFPGDSISSILYRIVNEPPRDPAGTDPPVPEPLRAFLARGLAKRPDERFASGDDYAEALRRSSSDLDADSSAATPGAEPPAGPVGSLPGRAGAPARSSARPFVLGAIFLVVAAGAALYQWREQLLPPPAPVVEWWEAGVRTEPAGLEVLLDGVPLEPPGRVRFASREPFGTLSATNACRRAEHVLGPEDAGGELVLVTDPIELGWRVDPGVEGARVELNGKSAGRTPVEVELDLCRTNRLEVVAAGFRPAEIRLTAGATPLEARTALYGLALEPIPRGTVVLPRRRDINLVYYVDGKRIRDSLREVVLEEGEHELRAKNEYHWIDSRMKVHVIGGETLKPEIPGLSLTPLVVQAFPANCKAWLRKPGGEWRYLDETPLTRQVAIGRYELKVQLIPTGDIRQREIELTAGANPPVRIAFGQR